MSSIETAELSRPPGLSLRSRTILVKSLLIKLLIAFSTSGEEFFENLVSLIYPIDSSNIPK